MCPEECLVLVVLLELGGVPRTPQLWHQRRRYLESRASRGPVRGVPFSGMKEPFLGPLPLLGGMGSVRMGFTSSHPHQTFSGKRGGDITKNLCVCCDVYVCMCKRVNS